MVSGSFFIGRLLYSNGSNWTVFVGREVNAIPFSARGCRDAGFQSVR